MSLSKQIIYATTDHVAGLLEEKPTLNEIDEYGYTPLVQTAIVNSVEKAELLLKAGADPNFTDLTGRSALHWAAENNNKALCELLLSYKADSNAYTRAGQSVLVMPLLRKYHALKKVLYQHEANLSFAQDFINAKTLGHRFELMGRVDIVDHQGRFIEMEFEGFYLEFTLAMVLASLVDFKRHYAGKHLRHHFANLDIIINSLHIASELIRYQHYLTDIKSYSNRINELLRTTPVLLPIAYEGHAISLIKFRNWLIRCDRGEYGRNNGTVIIYKIGRPEVMTVNFIRTLLYKRQHKDFINDGIVELLDLQAIDNLPLSTQLSGNCSWANVEAAVPALLYLLLLQGSHEHDARVVEEAKQSALSFYQQWQQWDQTRALGFCLQGFNKADPARKASKAAILAAILVQHIEPKESEDLLLAEKIIKLLYTDDFRYILESYASVLSQDREHAFYKNLAEQLEYAGIDIETLQKNIPDH